MTAPADLGDAGAARQPGARQSHGAAGRNLRQIEAALDVAITHRGGSFTIAGEAAQTARAGEALQRFYSAAEKPLSVEDIQLGLVEITSQPPSARGPARK